MSTPAARQLARKRSAMPSSGQVKTSVAISFSPGAAASAKAMKKRPSNTPISATGSAHAMRGSARR